MIPLFTVRVGKSIVQCNVVQLCSALHTIPTYNSVFSIVMNSAVQYSEPSGQCMSTLPECTECTVQCMQSTMCTIYYAYYSMCSTVYTVQYVQYSMHSTICRVHQVHYVHYTIVYFEVHTTMPYKATSSRAIAVHFSLDYSKVCSIEHYIILNNGILKSNSSIFPWSEGYITQYTPQGVYGLICNENNEVNISLMIFKMI